MKLILNKTTLLLLPLLMLPFSAIAHTGLGTHNGLLHGFSHPFSGLDHVLAMIAVGIWATQMSGRAIWLVPLVFVVVMVLGGLLGVVALPLVFVEHGIALSLLVSGGLIAAAIRLPFIASIGLISVFALCHGFAHGNEMPASTSVFSYATGFALATALLHLCGVALALWFKRLGQLQWLRLPGFIIALVGVSFLLTG
jgi:urease accessory protein